MSRLFDDAASQYLEYAGAVVGAAPFTMACWFKTDDATIYQNLMMVCDKDVGNNWFELACGGDRAGDPVACAARSASAYVNCDTTAGFTTGVWHHACGVFAATNDRRIYLNGANKGTEATTITPSGIDLTSVGMNRDSTPNAPFSGLIAWPCIWSVALSDADVAALAAGAFPPSIQPASVVDLWDLTRNVDPETPLPGWGSHNLTVNGATFSTDNPPVAWPAAALRRRSFGWSPGRA